MTSLLSNKICFCRWLINLCSQGKQNVVVFVNIFVSLRVVGGVLGKYVLKNGSSPNFEELLRKPS